MPVNPELIFASPLMGIPATAWMAAAIVSLAVGVPAFLVRHRLTKFIALAAVVLVLLTSAKGLDQSIASSDAMKDSIKNEADVKLKGVDLARIPAGERDQPHLIDLYSPDGKITPTWVSFDRGTGKATLRVDNDGSSHG